ncbi:MAG: hypothetical protein CL679_13715 [Bermanella sp.]|nr:hypothetical protein [Bermanella sp.]
MDVIWLNFFNTSSLQYWLDIFAICGACLFVDALIMSQLKGQHRAERSHYLLSILSVVCYVALFPLDSELFRHYWMQILLGLYLYDLCIIARDWRQLKPSYRTFYSVHHGASLLLFMVWHLTFVPFTDAMAIGALLWVSSDVWRWAEQFWRLSGRHSSNKLRDGVYYLERGHRIFSYALFLWILEFQFTHTSEVVLLVSGILMDIIDTYFQQQARRIHKIKQSFKPLPEDPAHVKSKRKRKKAA